MTGGGRWSTGNYARSLNLTIQTNGICTTKNLFWRMRCTDFSWGFVIHTDHMVSARRPELIVINKKVFAELWTLLSRQTPE